MQKKRIPLRMCGGCNQMKPKIELVRIVKSPNQVDEEGNIIGGGEILLDTTGKKPGRGAYVCKNVACLKAMRKARRLERSFSCQIPAEVYDQMEEEISQNE